MSTQWPKPAGIEPSSSAEGAGEKREEPVSPLERIGEAVRSLGEEQAQVLELLYGFGGRPSSIPEEVSRVLGCPLEAVAEMETAAVRRLRHPKTFKSIVQALDASIDAIWHALAGSDHLLFKSELQASFGERLPGELRVAIQVRHGTIQPWLAEHTCDTSKAWYRGEYSCEEVLNAISRVEGIHHEISLPTPLQFVSRFLGMDLPLLILAVKLADFSSIYKGYLSKSSLGIRFARVIDIHRLFASRYRQDFATLGQVVEDYRLFCPQDQLDPESAETALSIKPHLFISLGDMGWSAIGLPTEDLSYLNCGAPPTPPESDGRILRHLKPPDSEAPPPDPLDLIRQILAGGPCHVSEISRSFAQKASDAYGIKTLHDFLNASWDFVPIAPEIYALREHLDDPATLRNALPLLFTIHQCRIYIVSRHAGEPMENYPLWSLVTEERLCRWVEGQKARKIFASILAIAEPQSWDAPQATRDLWTFKKQCLGQHYRLALEPKKSVWQQRPRLQELFAAAVCARRLGYINWLRINHIVRPQLYEQLYDQDAAPILALLAGLQVVAPADHWQKAHPYRPDAEPLLEMLSQELQKTGSLLWEDEIGSELMEDIESNCQEADLGWVHRDQVMKLLEK